MYIFVSLTHWKQKCVCTCVCVCVCVWVRVCGPLYAHCSLQRPRWCPGISSTSKQHTTRCCWRSKKWRGGTEIRWRPNLSSPMPELSGQPSEYQTRNPKPPPRMLSSALPTRLIALCWFWCYRRLLMDGSVCEECEGRRSCRRNNVSKASGPDCVQLVQIFAAISFLSVLLSIFPQGIESPPLSLYRSHVTVWPLSHTVAQTSAAIKCFKGWVKGYINSMFFNSLDTLQTLSLMSFIPPSATWTWGRATMQES